MTWIVIQAVLILRRTATEFLVLRHAEAKARLGELVTNDLLSLIVP